MQTYTIGRNPSSQIVLSANFCSRDHAKLTISGNGKIFLQDTSSNGTTLNGKKINNQTVEVRYGDEILFAGVEKLDWSKIEKPEIKISAPVIPNPAIKFVRRHALKTIISLTVVGVLFVVVNFAINRNSIRPEIPLTPSDIYTRYQSAVALVEVKYFVRIHTKANEVYFGIEAGSTIGFSKTKSELQPLTSEGTAFFIDSNGTLITNHHVIEPWMHDRDLRDYFHKRVKPAIKKALRENGWGDDEPQFYGELEAIYIYPNGKTFSSENRIECSILCASDKEEIDLASLQVNSHRLPAGVKVVSTSDIETDEKKIKVNTPAYVIGFPYGDALALNEDNELHCSSTQGSFTQVPSKSYVQYSAQTASGGSGSPVFNEYGKLVAVTYLGSTSGQSFNRGILAKHIKRVL